MSAFHTQGDARGAGDVPTIGVGMLGYAFMGKAHSNAYRTLVLHDLAAAAACPSWWRSPGATRRRWPRPRGATASPAT